MTGHRRSSERGRGRERGRRRARAGLRGAAILLAALGPSAPAAAQAQGIVVPRGSAVVSGVVVAEDSGRPIPGTWVELIALDTLVVAQASTDGAGRFRVEDVPEGLFHLRISNLGYGTVSTERFEVAEAEQRNLGTLAMPVEAVEIAPLTVSTERQVVTYEADRIRYNVGVMAGTEGSSVTETLATIPELEVDIDGRVTLRGSDVVVYIDGRESPMTGEALALFLEQFPADYLAEIEVIDNPSARYDAEGSGGIVNLVTKEGVELGLSGTVFVNAGTRGQYGGGGRATLQRGPWTLDGGGFLRLSDVSSTSFDLRQNLEVDPAFLRQDRSSDQSRRAANVDLEVRWEPNDRARLYVEGRISGSGAESSGLTTTTHLDDFESTILAYDRTRSSDSRDTSFDLATGLDWEWEDGGELEVELEYERGSQREDSREEITNELDLVEGELIPAELTLEDEDEREDELTLGVDYVREWGERGEIEVGYRGRASEADLDRLIRLLEEAGQPGDLTDRGYDQQERSHALYTTLQRGFGPVGVELGLRVQHLDRTFDVPGAAPFDRTDTDFFPSANLSWRIDDARRLRVSYSRRVRQPGLSVLNPIDRSTDPLTRRVGNPEIEPQFTHSVSMNASWSMDAGSLRISPYWRGTTHGWAEITTVDAAGVSTETWQNVASQESWGASVAWSLPRRSRWGGHVSVSGRYEDRDASNLAERYSGTSFFVSSRANVNGRVTDDLSLQANVSWSPPTDLPQGRRDARYRADFGLRYRLLGDRGSLRLSLQDPFGLRRSSRNLRDVDYILVGRSEQSTRSATLNLSYALGGGGSFRGGRRGFRGR